MRVLIVSDTSGYMRGGVPAASRRLIEGLRRHGHEVAFCGDIALSDDPAVAFFPWDIFDVRTLADRLSSAIAACRPDIVHLISMSSRGVLASIPILAGQHWLLTCHSIPPYERKIGKFHPSERLHYSVRWMRYLANSLAWRYLFRQGRIPHAIAHSDWVAAIARRYGLAEERTTVIPLGNAPDADTASTIRSVAASSDAPLVVTVGGIAHTKGQHDALAAIRTTRNAFPRIQYRIVGETRDESYLAWLATLIRQWKLEPHVQILSALSHDDKQRLLSSADLYLQPSHEEGFCLALLEAAACVPRLVATDAGAMRSICGDDPGTRVVRVRDPSAMAAAIESTLRTPVSAEALQARLGRLDRDFGWQQYTDAHERLYGALLAEEDR